MKKICKITFKGAIEAIFLKFLLSEASYSSLSPPSHRLFSLPILHRVLHLGQRVLYTQYWKNNLKTASFYSVVPGSSNSWTSISITSCHNSGANTWHTKLKIFLKLLQSFIFLWTLETSSFLKISAPYWSSSLSIVL